MTRDEHGEPQKYSAEWANPARLNRSGVEQDTLKPGDIVVLTGSPSRNPGERRLHLKSIQRPADGWQWSGPAPNR